MLRDVIAPALRGLGFQGSAQSFVLRSDTHWALVGFQKSRDRYADSVKFTVNVTVVAREIWKVWREASPHLPARPHANVSYGPGSRQLDPDVRAAYSWERIGVLMPVRNDYWWEIRADTDTTHVAEEVIAAIRDYAIPEIRRHTSSNLRAPA
ncbi:MAG TPA: DUF4304 domain-containing protein [Candidatus Limnocylindria bacterium]|nr:DUF4304 domain-containing protein [Candidatus Limnocylindria bacterium]